MLCARVSDPQTYVFAELVVEVLGSPSQITASAHEIVLQWEAYGQRCMLALSVCGCCYVCGGDLQADEPLWEYACQWKPHVDAVAVYHVPNTSVFN